MTLSIRDEGRWTTVAGLVLANLVPVVGVVALGWDLHSLLVVYWVESGVVGLSFVGRIRKAEGYDDPAELPSLELNGRSVRSLVGASNRQVAAFFLFHYGLFWLFHGLFVLAFPFFVPGLIFASLRVVGLASVGLVAYHVISYKVHYVERAEYERKGPVTLMVEPYRRVFVLHFTVVSGGLVVGLLGSPVGALLVMVLAKTVLDLRGHWKEHELGEPQGTTA